jgi:hypothetical protein
MLTFSEDHRYATHVKVLPSKLIELEKLLNDKLKAEDTIGINSGIMFCGVSKST